MSRVCVCAICVHGLCVVCVNDLCLWYMSPGFVCVVFVHVFLCGMCPWFVFVVLSIVFARSMCPWCVFVVCVQGLCVVSGLLCVACAHYMCCCVSTVFALSLIHI